MVSETSLLSAARDASTSGTLPGNTLKACIDRPQNGLVQGGIPACHHGHLELVLGAQQRAWPQRAPVGVRYDGAGLLEDQRRGGEVVRRVVEHRSATHALELLAHARHVLHE